MSDVFGEELADKRQWLRQQWAAADEQKHETSSDLPTAHEETPVRRGHAKRIIALCAAIAFSLITLSALTMKQAPSDITKAVGPASIDAASIAPEPADVVEIESALPEPIDLEDEHEDEEVPVTPPQDELSPTPRTRRVRMRNENAPTKMGRDLWGW